MEEVVATGPGRRVYTRVLGRSSGRQRLAAVHSIHPLRRPPYIHPLLCPWGSFLSHCSAPRFKAELTFFVLLGEDWGSTDLPQRKKQQLGSNTTTTKDNGMEEEEASEVRKWSNSKYKTPSETWKLSIPDLNRFPFLLICHRSRHLFSSWTKKLPPKLGSSVQFAKNFCFSQHISAKSFRYNLVHEDLNEIAAEATEKHLVYDNTKDNHISFTVNSSTS